MALGELPRQFYPLGFPAGEFCRWLAKLDVPKPHIVQGLELFPDGRDGREEGQRLLHGHIQDLGDVLALVADGQGLLVVAGPLADVAGDVDVGEEVHLDLHLSLALAGLTAAAAEVEGKAGRGVAAHPRLGGSGKHLADGIEGLGVGDGVGAGGAADGRLVHHQYPLEMLPAQDVVVGPGFPRGIPKLPSHPPVEDLLHQGGFARAGNACYTDEKAHGKAHIDPL